MHVEPMNEEGIKKKTSTFLLTLIFVSDPRSGALIHQYTFTQLDAIPLVSWYHWLAKLSPKGQKTQNKEALEKGGRRCEKWTGRGV